MIDWQNIVWPLCFVLVALVAMRQLRNDLNPIFRNVVGGVALNASKNALPYAMAILMASAASLQALADVARDLHFAYLEAFSKIAQPGVVAIIAYVTKSPSTPEQPPKAP